MSAQITINTRKEVEVRQLAPKEEVEAVIKKLGEDLLAIN